jgi:2-polyprenyl-3-methyl-5-hydroxy-6-metoxy-1,4-benzoquinol methylase
MDKGKDLYQSYEASNKEFFNALFPKSFEYVNCLFSCKGGYIKLFEKDTMEIVRCSCGFVMSRYQPTQKTLDKFYKESRPMDLWSLIKKTDNKRQDAKFSPAVDFLLSRDVKSVCDLGCGNGYFLEMLRGYKPSLVAHGTEANLSAREACMQKGMMILDQTIDEFLKFNNRTYDVISLWGVLEHLKKPKYVLGGLKDHINKNGYLVICVPNVNSRIVRSLWKNTFTFCHQHLWYFDQTTLTDLLKTSGYETVHSYSIEGEAKPWLKTQWGLDPYKDVPDWVTNKYLNPLMIEAYDKMICKSGEGYKIVNIARKV